MGKNKLKKFADMDALPNVFQLSYNEILHDGATFPMRGRWRDGYFHNANPIVLELGCGKGEYTVGLARRFPDKNFIGIDIKGARMWTGATEAHACGMRNVAFLRTGINAIEHFFMPGEVNEIWITFADPQMKKVNKRLTSTYFLSLYKKVLVDGGTVHLKTDSNFLYTYTRLMAEKSGLPIEVATANLYSEIGDDPILSIKTYYERQWLARGIDIKYLRFRLPSAAQLAEPDVEIEFDTYRSYGRQKRSELDMGM
ncbi:MAG: tRNA (guanosine(46)-N7)-methyltransferase TrmB [bacterium]|uniref:tRNA (guanine-N(7)-)-methyltransferase n=1 Tax=Candidatus Aphodosoma intestinipullorum TaxID=2840674 RepID=A0A940IEZ0_9BACT|nr:tRNA (guanosine(46)-N7)-methyltransferase TrmB [Candidatus Aphodosoma intestinipullorum]